MKKAMFYKKNDNKISCLLCPRKCVLTEGQLGICNTRKVINGELIALNYGKISVLNLDPIEKKPLYHFFPGKKIFSIGSYGCNLKCLFCQNYTIAHNKDYFNIKSTTDSKDIVLSALKEIHNNNIGIAYTYNEPTVWFEYIYDTALQARNVGLKNIMVSNGYIEEAPLKKLLTVMDAFSIDLKAGTDLFYKNLTSSSLNPVLKTLKLIANSDKILEVDYLVIPTKNDNPQQFESLMRWYSENLGKDIPIHINRYYPMYKLDIPSTTMKTLKELYLIAKKYLVNVYIGNIKSKIGNNSFCPNCNEIIIDRDHNILDKTINEKCFKCGTTIYGNYIYSRKESVAGHFYPSTPSEIKQIFEKNLERIAYEKSKLDMGSIQQILKKKRNFKIFGGIIPHAGYKFSSKTATYIFDFLESCDEKYDSVIVINPNHKGIGFSVEVDNYDYIQTPLGNLKVDKEIIKELKLSKGILAQNGEHSGEVIMPFIKYFLQNNIEVVSISMLHSNYENSLEVAKQILSAQIKTGKNILLLASSDFNHFAPEEIGRKLDNYALESIYNLDSKEFLARVQKNNISICGYGPIMVLMEYMKLQSNLINNNYNLDTKPKLTMLDRSHSGEVMPSNSVVDYISLIGWKDLNKIGE